MGLATIEESERQLAKSRHNIEARCINNPDFAATMLNKILYFNEPERVAILVLSIEELRAENEELRRKLGAEIQQLRSDLEAERSAPRKRV